MLVNAALRLFPLLLLIFAATAKAQEPRWEAGLGFGALYLPDYRGSDEEGGYVAPWPYIVYYGDRFALDREGLRGRIPLAARISVVASMSAATPVNSDENEARAGMPDLGFALEAGPSLEVDVWRGEGRKRLTFELPVRAVFATDFSNVDYIGWMFTPRFVFHVPYYQVWPREWDLNVTVSSVFGSDRYHDYYYQVAPQYETPTRPAYDAQEGYSGFRASAGASTRAGNYWFGAYVRYEDLSGAVFMDSPLIRTDRAFVVSAGMAYVFARSEERTHYHR